MNIVIHCIYISDHMSDVRLANMYLEDKSVVRLLADEFFRSVIYMYMYSLYDSDDYWYYDLYFNVLIILESKHPIPKPQVYMCLQSCSSQQII